jgi:tocopherol O-methyltransferase
MLTPELVAWYEEKTSFLLEKYGPGPRVHYHTGLVPPEEPAATDLAGMSRQLVASQERMLDHAASLWDARTHLSGEVADIGCGLGGSAIYFAERWGARVTGLTPVPGHLPLIARFAAEAGVSDRIAVEQGDAHTMPGEARFDAAYAFGAANYFDRARWFRRLRTLLRPGGRVFIEDTLWTRPELAAPFNAYWLSNMGNPDEYVASARAAGFALVRLDDVTRDAAGFWRVSLAYSKALLERDLSPAEQASRRRSVAWTSRFYEGHLDGGYRNLLFHFALT